MRVDSGVRAGSAIAEIYDPMIAKLVVWDVDREAARRRMLRALDEYVVEGPVTLIPFHRFLLEQEEFIAGGACHALLARMAEEPTPIPAADGGGLPADEAGEAPPQAERRFTAEVGGRRFEVALRYPEGDGAAAGAPAPAARRAARAARAAAGAAGRDGAAPDVVATPMQGTVLRVLVEVGQEVARRRRRLHRRGHEDGERGGRAPAGHRARAARGRGSGRAGRRGRRRHLLTAGAGGALSCTSGS